MAWFWNEVAILKKPRKSPVVVCSISMIELHELYELYQSHFICQLICETFTHVLKRKVSKNKKTYTAKKIWSFPLRISSINVTKFTVSCVTFTEEILDEKLHFLCSVMVSMLFLRKNGKMRTFRCVFEIFFACENCQDGIFIKIVCCFFNFT